MSAPWSQPRSGWPLGAGAFLAAVLIAGGLGVAASILSPALGLDLISLWLGLVPAFVAAVVVTLRKAWRRRFGALPFLLILTWLGLGAAAHFDGWPPLPSSAAELEGPESLGGRVSLEAHLDGTLEVESSGRPSLYEVRFVRRGGQVGVPRAEETTLGDQVNVRLQQSSDSAWLRYSGWDLLLSTEPSWDLDLSGEPIDADLGALEVSSLSVRGEGRISLGTPSANSQVDIQEGEFDLTVPGAIPVTVIGTATVPQDWEAIDGGFQTTEQGSGWLITVAVGATVRIGEA